MKAINPLPIDCAELFKRLEDMPLREKVATINSIRLELAKYSPFKAEPVDCIQWVPNTEVRANEYNPNTVAPPEMKLLELSIQEDGYTQPIVSWARDGVYEVVDGFHRHRVGKESKLVAKRVQGYLPLVVINNNRVDLTDRMASTIRHNRARGKHRVDAMSDIVLELKARNRSNAWIAKQLGMEEDEILRLCQITGLADLFSDDDFSKSWSIEGSSPEDFDFKDVEEESVNANMDEARTVNTSDPNRVFHTYDKWECNKAGFYASRKQGMTKTECEQFYATFLSDTNRFSKALEGVTSEWKNSCEHYLTNSALNRIAWLGQAAVCYESGIPSCFCSGFNLLSEGQQQLANETALIYLNSWLETRKMPTVTLKDATTVRQSTLY